MEEEVFQASVQGIPLSVVVHEQNNKERGTGEVGVMTMDEQIRALIRECSSELKKSSRTEGNPRSREYYCPMLTFFWNGITDAGKETVQERLAETWVLSDGAVQFLDGDVHADIKQAIHDGMILIRSRPDLQTISSFRTMTDGLVFHYVSSDSPELYLELERIKEGAVGRYFGMNQTLTLVFLMCNHRDNPQRAMDAIQSLIELRAACPKVTAVVLSNMLSNGRVLDENSNAENYRLAANIQALADSPNQGGNLRSNLFQQNDQMITASYLLIQKPCREIAESTLHCILESRKELAERDYDSWKELAGASIAFQNEISGGIGKGIPCLEDLFENVIRPQLPILKDMEYIPGWEKTTKEDSFSSADEKTKGFLGAFVRQNFFDLQYRLVGPDVEKALRQTFRQEMTDKFDYLFISEYFDKCSEYLKDILPATSTSKGNLLYSDIVGNCKCRLYEILIPLLKDEMASLKKQSGDFKKNLEIASNRLKVTLSSAIQELVPVGVYYGEKLKKVLSIEYGGGNTVLKRLKISADMGMLLQCLHSVYSDVILDSEYTTSFEEEIGLRLIKNTTQCANTKIAGMLNSSTLDLEYRIPLTNANQIGSYCMVGGDRGFLNLLDDSTGDKISVEGSNCAERFILFRFSRDQILK